MRTLLLLLILSFSLTGKAQLKLNLLPEIPYPDSNPYMESMYKAVKQGNQTTKTSFKEADEILPATYSYLHPQSKLKGNKKVLQRLLFLMNDFLSYWPKGEKIGDMMFASQCTQAYYMLKLYSPQDLPADRLAVWDEGIRKQTEFVLNQKNDLYDKLEVATLWLNGDIRLILGVYFGGKILDRKDWTEKAEDVLEKVVPQTLLNGGGTRYVSYQNESPSYHIASKQFMYWWYVMTGSGNMKKALSQMTPYAPLTIHPIGKGYAEYTSSPSWKLYYNSNIPTYPAAIAAFMFNDGYNYTLGENDKTWDLVFIYQPNIKKKQLPDNFVVFDENNIGPRGRFGNWGYVGVGRNVQSGIPELGHSIYPAQMDGKQSFAGAYILDAHTAPEKYPLNAAFQSSMPAIKTSKGKETDFGRGKCFTDLTANEHTTLNKGEEIYSLATRYTLCKRGFKTIPWDGMQQWVFTPNRIIGLLTVEATRKEETVYGLVNRIKLVSGRLKVTGSRKEIKEVAPGIFEYGDLKICIHDENYQGGTDISYFGIYNNPDDNLSCMLTVRDKADKGEDAPLTFAKGTRRHLLIEVVPIQSSFAKNVKKIEPTNTTLLGFEFEADGQKVCVVHNPSTSIEKHSGSLETCYPNLFIQKSWIENKASEQKAGKKSTMLSSIDIPPYEHLLFINSKTFNPRFNRYKDIFK